MPTRKDLDLRPNQPLLYQRRIGDSSSPCHAGLDETPKGWTAGQVDPAAVWTPVDPDVIAVPVLPTGDKGTGSNGAPEAALACHLTPIRRPIVPAAMRPRHRVLPLSV
jgi:hypothetical protein